MPPELPPPLAGPSIAIAAFGAFWIGYTVREWHQEMKPQGYDRARMALRVLLAAGLIGVAMWGT
jgi:hypothetical protein